MGETDILNFAAASGAGASAVFGAVVLFLLKKLFSDSCESLARTEKLVSEYRSECQARYEKTITEYRQIMESLNEIKIELARTEATYRLENILLGENG